ncbi:MAG: hypothetical protein K6T83_00865 [Alicyclobacillus sp.]|nr:hypothetical protein [Alicyclobacillus sp.]
MVIIQIIVYVVLLILGAGAYLWTKRNGNRGGQSFRDRYLRTWLGSSTLRWKTVTQGASQANNQTELDDLIRPTPEIVKLMEVQVTAVLNDMYQQFQHETKRVRSDAAVAMERLRAELFEQLMELRNELEQLKTLRLSSISVGTESVCENSEKGREAAATSDDQFLCNAPGEASSSQFDPLYFQIYDELQAGRAPDDIAQQLGIGVEVVQLVARVMAEQPDAE